MIRHINKWSFLVPIGRKKFDFILETKMVGLAQCVGEKGKNTMLMIWSSSASQA